jgi:gliding motility-associated-like protein
MVTTFIAAQSLPNDPELANDTICNNFGPISIGVQSAPNLNYTWTPENNLSDPHTSNPVFTADVTGPVAKDFTYVLTASDGDCAATDTTTITVDPGPMARFTYNPDPVSSEDPTVFFENNTIGRDDLLYFWEFDTLGVSEEENPSFKFPDGINDKYDIELTAIDPLTGCMDERIEILKVQPEMLMFVPNAFTPDGDGLNDLWGPVLRNVDEDEYKLTIFDRFGNVVFTTRNLDKKWNGSTNGDGYYAQDGVYTWMIETKNRISLEEVTLRGHVTVVR